MNPHVLRILKTTISSLRSSKSGGKILSVSYVKISILRQNKQHFAYSGSAANVSCEYSNLNTNMAESHFGLVARVLRLEPGSNPSSATEAYWVTFHPPHTFSLIYFTGAFGGEKRTMETALDLHLGGRMIHTHTHTQNYFDHIY